MALNAPAWLLANAFTKDTANEFGAVKGAPCTVGDVTFDADGNTVVELVWTNSAGQTRITPATIKKGEKGDTGETGEQGPKGDIGATGERGEKGDKGDRGVGIESITKQSTSGLTDTYLITFADGTTTTYDVVNGANVTKVSQLENDSEFITNATIGLINYYMKDEVYNKAKIDELLRNVGAGLSVKIVSSLPTEEISGTTIYLINTTGSNYNQYMYIDGDWASLGSTSVDLSSYYNKAQVDTMLLEYITASTLLTQLMQYTKTADLAKVAKSNDYNDLDNLPEIPDVSGIKPYTDTLQDSSNTAPTSKALYDAVQTVNQEVGKKANTTDLNNYAKKTDIPTDYLTENALMPYAKAEDVEAVTGDLAGLETTEKSSLVGAVNEVNTTLGELESALGDKADKNAALNSLEIKNSYTATQIIPWIDGTHYRSFEDKSNNTYTDIVTNNGIAKIARTENGILKKSEEIATMDKIIPSIRLESGFKVVAYSDRAITGNSKLECLENWVTNALSKYGDNLVIIGNIFNMPYIDGFAIVNVWGSKKDGILGASGILVDQEGMYYYHVTNGISESGTLTKINQST